MNPTKQGSLEQHNLLHQHFPSDCCLCRLERELNLIKTTQRECITHCYCKKMFIENGEHLVCCMCGHRTLINSIKKEIK